MFEFNFDNIAEVKNTEEIHIQNKNMFSLVVDRNHLVKSISRIQNVVEKRNIIPILANIRLVAEAGKLELLATDMDIAASEKIVAHIEHEGAITLNAQTLYDIIRKLPDGGSLTIKICNESVGKVSILNENCNFTLPYIDADDFPTIDKGVMPFSFLLSSSEIKSFIDKGKFAICTEETRYNLNGIYIHIVANSVGETVMQAVATDGHRLSCIILTTPEGAEKMPGVILPKKTIQELRKIIEDVDGDIKIELSETKIKCTFGETEFISKLIDGNFPEYSAFIPKETTYFLEINKKIFAQAIDRVTTISFEKTRSVKLKINNNKIEFSVVNLNGGDAMEIAECKSSLENFEVAFNSKYLFDVLSVIEGETIELSFVNSDSPVMLKDKTDKSAIFVIMPLRL